MKQFAFALAVLALGATACQKEKTTTPASSSAVDLGFIKSGNSWTYEAVFYDSMAVPVDTIPEAVIFELRSNTGDLYPLHLLSSGDSAFETEPVIYWSKAAGNWGQADSIGGQVGMLLKSKPVKGDKYTSLLDGGDSVDIEVVSLSEKTVVRGGSFNAIKLKLSDEDYLTYYYIVSGIGLVKIETYYQNKLEESINLQSRNF
jgi:hypothetical protein